MPRFRKLSGRPELAELIKSKGEQQPRNKHLFAPVPGMKTVVVERLTEDIGAGINVVEAYEDMGYEIHDPKSADRRRVKMVIPQEEYDAQHKANMDTARARANGRIGFDPGPGVKSLQDEVESLGTTTLEQQINIGNSIANENA